MKWLLFSFVGLAIGVNCLGCSICCAPFDHYFVAYGSKTPRTDMVHGRVGSPFSDAAMIAATDGPMTSPAPPIELTPVEPNYGDVLEQLEPEKEETKPVPEAKRKTKPMKIVSSELFDDEQVDR